MLITRVWSEQPGKYFCISTKNPKTDEWHDEFFARAQFLLVQPYIDEMKAAGCNVYWCCHGFNMKRRLRRYAEMPKLMWADLDETDPRGLENLRPTIAIESSPGRFAAWWMLTEPLDDDSTNQKLSYHLKADKGGWDLTQVLRVPGTQNFKYPGAPRVRILWQDGPKYSLDQIKAVLPKAKERPNTGTVDVAKIFKKYRNLLSPWARRELLKGKPRQGTRSEVFWKLTNEMLEVGASDEEAFEILWASPWNKFKDRRDGMKQLHREIEKIYSNKMDSVNPQQEYEESSELPEEDGSPELKVSDITASFVGIAEPEAPRWVVYPYLLRGHITSIEGDPEVGKSWLSLAMSASISEGKKRFPVDDWEDKNERGAVFYFDAENDIGNVAQRMADSEMFTKVTNPHDQAPFFHVKMRADFREEEAIDDVRDRIKAIMGFYKNNKNYETKTALIIFDTFINFAGDTDTNKQSDVMNALSNLKTLAEEEDCSVVIIRHYGKTAHANSMHRGIGSTQFAATCRAMVGVHRHPDDPDTRVVTISKSSLASKSNLRTLSYNLQPVFSGTVDTNKRDRTRMVWGDWIDLNEYDISESMKDAPKKAQEQRETRKKLGEIIDGLMATNPNGVSDELMKSTLERNAIPISSLSRTLGGYNIRPRPTGKGGTHTWVRAISA